MPFQRAKESDGIFVEDQVDQARLEAQISLLRLDEQFVAHSLMAILAMHLLRGVFISAQTQPDGPVPAHFTPHTCREETPTSQGI